MDMKVVQVSTFKMYRTLYVHTYMYMYVKLHVEVVLNVTGSLSKL